MRKVVGTGAKSDRMPQEMEPTSDVHGMDAGTLDVAIVGAGPAGLFAAERLSAQGYGVVVFERMPSPARKLLMAGRGGLNLTHSEPLDVFLRRYRPQQPLLLRMLCAFPSDALVSWIEGLGIATYIGSSGRIFPTAMKASPLLRAWLNRLTRQGVQLRPDHTLVSLTPVGHAPAADAPGAPAIGMAFARKGAQSVRVKARAVLLAMGGASWPRLGSDGTWVSLLGAHGIDITSLAPANAGLLVPWSRYLTERFAGTPLKRMALSADGTRFAGEVIVTRTGLEGTPAYTAGPLVREALARADGAPVRVSLDLRPDLSVEDLTRRLSKPRGKQSMSNHLRKVAGLPPLAIALLREPWAAAENGGLAVSPDGLATAPEVLAARIKALPLPVTGIADLERAISTAGGVAWSAVDDNLMAKALPGVFLAGEMLDWEAPTGGYLLQGCFATGAAAADGIGRFLVASAAVEGTS